MGQGTLELRSARLPEPSPGLELLRRLDVPEQTRALIVRIREAYGTVEEDEILAADQESQC